MRKSLQLFGYEFGDFLGKVVAGGKRTAAHIIRDAPPFVEGFEAPFDHAPLAPQAE